MTCKHEMYLPEGNGDDWHLMNWTNDEANKDLTVDICKKCGVLFGKGMKR